jgi:hypothetical protein
MYHQWNKIIYNKTGDITDEGITSNLIIVDYECSICGVRRSKTNTLDKKKVYAAYAKKSKIIDLFSFFSVRCPEYGIHEFTTDTCSKCKGDKNIFSNTDIDATNVMSYYEKYKTIYDDKIKQLHLDLIIKTNYKSEPTPERITWTYNEGKVAELAQLISKSMIVLTSIGAMEGRTVIAVNNGKNRPSYPVSYDDVQILIAESHFLNTISIYNMIRNSIYTDSVYTKVMSSADISNQVTGTISKILLEYVYDVYVERYRKARNDLSKTPKDIYMLLIESICAFILDISRNKKIGMVIAKYLINNILKHEYYTCVPDIVDFTLFKRFNSNILNESVSADAVFDQVYEEEYEKEDLQMFVNDLDYDGHND